VSTLRGPRSRSRAQALVEFAVVIPVFLFLLMGIVDFGRVIWATTSLASAAREATRFAIVRGGSVTDACPVGPMGPDSPTVAASSSCPYPAPSKQSIINTAVGAATAGGSNLTVAVCYADPATGTCSGDTDTGTNARGQTVTVVVTSSINLITPAILGVSSFSISGSSTMTVNH
jgi:Flp pilus assembly protein TadG